MQIEMFDGSYYIFNHILHHKVTKHNKFSRPRLWEKNGMKENKADETGLLMWYNVCRALLFLSKDETV